MYQTFEELDTTPNRSNFEIETVDTDFSDPADYSQLTPDHFFIDRPLTCLPQLLTNWRSCKDALQVDTCSCCASETRWYRARRPYKDIQGSDQAGLQQDLPSICGFRIFQNLGAFKATRLQIFKEQF